MCHNSMLSAGITHLFIFKIILCRLSFSFLNVEILFYFIFWDLQLCTVRPIFDVFMKGKIKLNETKHNWCASYWLDYSKSKIENTSRLPIPKFYRPTKERCLNRKRRFFCQYLFTLYLSHHLSLSYTVQT